ncbi:efflux RND transporter periplasmic adaptor subunit [Ruegeria atlantica]|uniref:efflux RND transporter periplasmic adaptor subunit n=1 Tax=Ruegeria atlantica TaxID=81569 RepID=UPI00147C1BA4|nr:efflux RND transporter periplasmic adaptor subunit [Ruegeria atlantica]
MPFAKHGRFVPCVTLCFVASAFILTASVQAQTQEAQKPSVVVAEATLEAVTYSDTYLGRVEAIASVDVISRVAGFIEKINFQDGAKVTSGDVLIEIESDTYKADITQIQGQIESAKAEKKIADIELDRQQKLFERGDAAEAVVQRAQAQKGQADGLITQLQGSLQNAQIQLSYTKIMAPFEGRIGLTNLSKGAFVDQQTGALLTLTSIDPIYVTFPVANAQLLDFQKQGEDLESGQVALQLTLANGEVYKENGKVAVIDTTVQENTDTVLVRGVFPNPDGALLNNQLAKVAVIDKPDQKFLTIPADALQSDQDGYFVLTVGSDGKVAKAPIKTREVTGTQAVVTEGLKAGDKVITQGAQKVRVGMEVNAEPADASNQPAKE